ncbi:RecQ family ATP-dependent DNA helicase [bacterium]|nr:RecQ family ATP-dependent DNA helicase [bacterium]
MIDQLRSALSSTFGFAEFRPGQEIVCRHLLEGRSAAAVFATGGGKSLCYQLPALLLPGTTLVVSPLIALMKDQIDALKARGVAAARLDSTLTFEEYRSITQQIRRGELKLLYVAPERFSNERFRELLSCIDVSLFAVDEAHCISEWGHNFRPDYLKLARFARDAGAKTILALTATATPQVLDDMCRFFEIAPDCAVLTPFYRENLSLLSRTVTESQRDAALIELLRTRTLGPTIVYVTLQRTAEEVALRLTAAGFAAKPYHAGMENDVRAATQDWFMTADNPIVVATIAFGMGIDKSDIRYVYHYNVPKSLENYAQEIGRAGRDGQSSVCEMLYCQDDLNVLENFIFGDTPEAESVAGLVREVLTAGDEIAVTMAGLSSRHDIRPLVVRTLLTYLEMDGWLEELTPVYANYQFIPQLSSAEILGRFEGERRDFLRSVFAQSKKARTWFSIDLDETARMIGSDRARIVRALDWLAEQQMLELKPSGLTNRFRRVKQSSDLSEIEATLTRRMQHREERDLQRLGEVVALATADQCRASLLGAHFGEPLNEPCGHCSACARTDPVDDPLNQAASTERSSVNIDETIWREAAALRETERATLASPQRFAKFLCGISSPRLTRAKLSSHPLFGILEHVPFQQLLDRANTASVPTLEGPPV